jgi:hypothetical protein
MKKKISILILGLIIVGAIFFVYFKFFRLTPVDQWAYVESSPREDYIVEEVDGRMFVNNEKAGISFFVPEGWEIRDELNDAFVIYTEGAINNEERKAFLEEGCRIIIETSNIKTNTSYLKEQFKENDGYYPYDHNEFIESNLNNKPSLEHLYKYISIKNYFREIYITSNNKLFTISLTKNNGDARCDQNIGDFLNEINIK